MRDIHHNLVKELNNNMGSVSAIEMTPAFHMELMRSMEAKTPALEINGIPIIFVHGDNQEYKFLDSRQYRLRIRHNDILGLYDSAYKRLSLIINRGYMIAEGELLQDSLVCDLKKFVKRLDTIEQQISMNDC